MGLPFVSAGSPLGDPACTVGGVDSIRATTLSRSTNIIIKIQIVSGIAKAELKFRYCNGLIPVNHI